MTNFKLTVAYEGTDFCGWQVQPGLRTVQAAVEKAWQEITGEQVRVTSTSRTDSGVHAHGQVVGVETATQVPANKLLTGMNAKLPEDILVLSVEDAPTGFHATYDSLGKRYRYQLHNDRRRPLFERPYVWHVPQPLDVEAMHRAAQTLVGKHDFVSFQSAGSDRESTVRTLSAVQVLPGQGKDGAQVWIEVEGDGFLYKMVRIIVGSLVAIGLGRQPESWLAEVLAAHDRDVAGQTAPPEGLFLLFVNY
jgi:tRNA pseudouridine38-40 synthase